MGWGVESGSPDATSSFRNYPHDPLNIWDPRDFGPTDNDERHHTSLSGIVQLPAGFQLAPIISYGSARPYDLRSGFDVLDRGSGYSRAGLPPNSAPTHYTAISDAATALAGLAAGYPSQGGFGTGSGGPLFPMGIRVTQ